jgi:TonB family protein
MMQWEVSEMRSSILALALASLCFAPATAARITITPLVAAQSQSQLPVLVNACVSPNTSAGIAGDAFFEAPSITAAQGLTGTSTVKVQLSSTGALLSNSLFASSGNRWMDEAALRSARMSRFSPEVRNCERVGGTYLYAVEF